MFGYQPCNTCDCGAVTVEVIFKGENDERKFEKVSG